MSVARIWESPRVTKPYTEEQWQTIDQLGHAVDAELTRNDLRLTMGGEPTFVSMDDPEGEEWNMAALGPSKRRLAADLYHRLRKRYRQLLKEEIANTVATPSEVEAELRHLFAILSR